MNLKRIRKLNSNDYTSGPVLYWMVRDQRAVDNWALYYAQHLAEKFQQPLIVIFALRKDLVTHHGTARMLDFMLNGLEEVESQLEKMRVPFTILLTDDEPNDAVEQYVGQHSVGAVVSDFSPLTEQIAWKKKLADSVSIPVFEVDTHNIVPCWIASSKQEFAAYTFRPKITKLLPKFLDELPALHELNVRDSKAFANIKMVDWKEIRSNIKVDESVRPVDWLTPGTTAGYTVMAHFLDHIKEYTEKRNDPNAHAVSNLSPYLHFGQISAQRVALNATQLHGKKTDSFLEELIVRRELSDNFCFYNQNYKTTESFPNWAKKTFEEHIADKREFLYSADQLEKANTHDELWNASQMEMMKTGKMHGYMRMYWVKKILEWTESPAKALEIAIYLNDKYELDGRDPNGYVGILWSIGGVHDRAWFDRNIFGKIRYMNANGAKKKFDVQKYISGNQ